MSKTKRKLRAITNAEFCDKWKAKNDGRCYNKYECCPLFFREYSVCVNQNTFRFMNNKYIFIEVRE